MIVETRMRRPLAGGLLILAILSSPGCVAVPPAILLSAGLSAAPAGVAAYQRGTFAVTLMLPQDRAYDATMAAMEDLDIEIVRVRFDETSAFLLGRDERGVDVTVRFERYTEVVTSIRIRVGAFGNRTFSQLLFERMREHAGLAGGEDRGQTWPS
jgi:hypothetical protein